ncbi:MAG TPA: hypothetical protein DEH78_05940 [Solibacterales bacterium]|nr:hypothetical protein [Bryobacterales bacterium]
MRRLLWVLPIFALASFDTPLLLETTSEDSAGLSMGDLNNDGRVDIVLAKGRHKPLHNRVLLNDGKGGYTASNLSATPDRTYSTALADIDRDGDLDIVVSNDAPDRKLVYKNDGRGRFTPASTFGEPGWVTRYVTLADLNNDGFPDIAAANRGGDRAVPSFVCWNDRSGGFPACDPIPSQSATSIAAADFDGDGAIDLFVPHREGGQGAVLWNDGKGRFPVNTHAGAANAAIRIAAAGDLNGDKQLDLAYIDERAKAAFIVLNVGGRRFAAPVRLPGAERVPYALALADLDGDRALDIVIGFVELPGAIYYNAGKGEAFREASWNDGKGTVYGMAFSDLNGDGLPDIAAARSGAPNAVWLSRRGR